MKNVCVALLFLVLASGTRAQDPEDFRPTMRAFLQKLGRPDTVDAMTLRQSGLLVDGQGADYMITISVEYNDVVGWSDDRAGISTNADPGTGTRVNDAAEAQRIAARWLEMAGIVPYPMDECVTREEGGVTYEYDVVYRERPHGYRGGTVNAMEVAVNAFSGEVVLYMAGSHQTYDEPVVNFTEAQALAAATRRLRAVYGVEPTDLSVGALTYYSPSSDQIAERSYSRADRKRSRLGYRVTAVLNDGGRANQASAFVDARTGEVMGGGIAKGSVVPKQASKSPATGKTSQPATSTAVPAVIGAGLAILVGGLLLFRKFAH